MALALLGRRQGRNLLRALSLSNMWLENGAAGRAYDCETETEACSTSQQQPLPCAGSWPRTLQLRTYAQKNSPTIRYVPVPEPAHDDFKAEPTTYSQLLGAIRNAGNLKRMQHLITTHADRLDVLHVVAAVSRLPRVIKYRPQDLVDRKDTVVVPASGLPRMRRKHGAKPKQSQLEDGARLAAQLDELLPRFVPQFFPRQAACCIWAFGELRRQGIITHMASLPDVLLAVTKGDFQLLRVHGYGVDFAQLLQGLAKLSQNDKALVERLEPVTHMLVSLLRERLDALQQRELQMVAWSLANLGHNDPAIYHAIADQLLRVGTAFLLPSGACGVFWAFAKAGVQRFDLFESLAGSMAGQALMLSPQDISATLWACCQLRYDNSQLFQLLADAMLRQLTTSSDWEVSSAVHSLARLGFQHTPLMDAVATAILAEPIIGAPPLCIARVLLAFGMSGGCTSRGLELATKLADAVVPRLPTINIEVLALTSQGLTLLGYGNQPGAQDVLSAIAARAERLLQQPCSDESLVTVLRLLDSAGHPFYQLAVAAARHLQTVIIPGGKYRINNLVELLYVCARQGVDDPEAAASLMAAADKEGIATPSQAAMLLVIGQVMNRKELVLTHMAELVQQRAAKVDAKTAAVALRSATAMGMTDVAQALQVRLHGNA